MFVFTATMGEKIRIGDDVVLRVQKVDRDSVQLMVEAGHGKGERIELRAPNGPLPTDNPFRGYTWRT